ncbi:MAG: hypothetical protein ACI3Z7_02645, partial [Candidatus Aphodosoma sp.]
MKNDFKSSDYTQNGNYSEQRQGRPRIKKPSSGDDYRANNRNSRYTSNDHSAIDAEYQSNSYNRDGGYNRENGFRNRESRQYNRDGGYGRENGFRNRENRQYNRDGGYNRENGFQNRENRQYNRDGG